MKYKNCLLIFTLFTCGIVFSEDNLLNDPTQIYQSPESQADVINQSITITRSFNNINELANKINLIDGLSAKVLNETSDNPIPVNVVINNGTIKNLLEKTASKLGYNWVLVGSVINFSAIHPKQKVSTQQPIQQNTTTSIYSKISNPLPLWELNPRDKTLRDSLNKWCKKSGWQLVWNVKADYPIDTSWTINSSFESAVNEVLKATQHTEMPLMAVMHDSNRVLEIYSPVTSK